MISTENWNTLTVVHLLESLRQGYGENYRVEVKAAEEGFPTSIYPSLSAFANRADGGAIVLGVKESDNYQPCGVYDVEQCCKHLAQASRDVIQPPIPITITPVEVPLHNRKGRKETATVIIADVAPLPLEQRPATYNGRAYVRVWEAEHEMQPWELSAIELQKALAYSTNSPDRTPLDGVGREMLDQKLVAEFCKNIRTDNKRNNTLTDEELLTLYQVLRNSDKGTNVSVGGLYGLGIQPQIQFAGLGVTCSVKSSESNAFSNSTERVIKNLRHFAGPVSTLLEQTMDWFDTNLAQIRRYGDNGHMIDQYEVPLAALREFVANALVHRNLTAPVLQLNQGIEIRITPEKIVISNLGGLQGISTDALWHPESREVTRAEVNPLVYAIARTVHTSNGNPIIEGEGGGVHTALIALREHDLRPPHLSDSGSRFTVIIHRGSVFSEEDYSYLRATCGNYRTNRVQREALIMYRNRKTIDQDDLLQKVRPCTLKEIHNAIDLLIEQGFLPRDVYAQPPSQPRNPEKRPKELKNQKAQKVQKAQKAQKALSKNAHAVLEALHKHPAARVEELSEACGLSVRQVRFALKPLIDAHWVTVDTAERAYRYTAVAQP